jgi:hypothetical protein
MSNFRELVRLAIPAFAFPGEALDQAVATAHHWPQRSAEPTATATGP